MNSRFTFPRVGAGIICGLAITGAARQVLAADASDTKAKGRMTTLEPAAPSRVAPAGPTERSQIGLGVGFYTESSERRDEAFIGGQEPREIEPVEFENDSVFNIQAWYLRPIWVEGLRWGGGLAWYNQYSVKEPEAEEDEEPYVFGQLFQLGLQGEYEIARVVSDLGVVFGLRAGGSFLFPSDNLRDEIENLEQRGFEVWTSPQFGAYITPLAGVRWPLSKRVSLRADLSVQFSKLWLYGAEGEAAGITSESHAALGTTRTQLLLGLDFGL